MIKVVCLGDSITQGYPYGQEASWVHILNTAFDFERDVNFINAGINGHTTGDMLARFDSHVLDRQPQAVTILGGTNDAWQGIPLVRTQENLTQMVARARKNRLLPVLGLITPIVVEQVEEYFPGDDANRFAGHLTDIRNWIKKFALDQKIPLLDFFTPLCIENTDQGNPKYFADGGHPNKEGYGLLAKSIYEDLKAVVERIKVQY
ncbi:SGNH/GDSL hydrolase family protein [Desulfofalx alkaliphila]|uniref:SGNH/GDSL hydrolase family protein n=1 Tax=Desulfofalx alkaliphila TaxID=105483 RepID=UPI00068A3284|nr:SGNH/GDSL hydrolase family protein [Desulfofalx alkaliphila]